MPQSGRRGMFASRTNWPLERNRFSLALENHRRTGAKLFDLTASNPTTCGFAYPEHEILAALADPSALTYRPESKGLREAREAVANYYRGRAGSTSPESQRVDASSVRGERGRMRAFFMRKLEMQVLPSGGGAEILSARQARMRIWPTRRAWAGK